MNKLLFILGSILWLGLTLQAQDQINRAEYFFDTDPGVGNGIDIPVSQDDTVLHNLTISTAGLNIGYHYLWVRTQDEQDQWSIYYEHLFYVYDSSYTSLEVSQPQITAAEYFVDTDPGVGNGTPITITPGDTVLENFTLNTGSLPVGYHHLWVRTKDLNGKWSIYDDQMFYIYDNNYIDETVTQAQIVGAEYFIDTDPGVGNGTPISITPGDTILENFSINLASYLPGTYMLYVRTVDANGRWSLHQREEFEIVDCNIPTADFAVPSQVCLGDAITMTDNSTDVDLAATYEWDIDSDGTVDYTTVGDITHTFSSPGVYDVTLTVINDVGCSDDMMQTIEVVDYSAITDTQTACDSYTWSANGTTYTTSGQYTETLTSTLGCDSIVTLDLTIGTATTGTDVVEACETFTWIDGNTYTSSNNTATHTLTNAAGCDSVVTLDLTINQPTTGTDVVVRCNDFTWIDGNTYTTSNNTATFTLTSAAGCDSVVTLDLTIDSFVTGTDVISACETYTWIDGNTYTSDNNTATHTLTNAAGCDSVVTLDLTILNSTTGTDVQTACDSYTWIDGSTYTSSNNTATHTLTNAAGCDSVVTLDLTILNSTIGTDEQTACDSYTWIDGNTYTSSNISATHILTNAAGCDSVVTLNLTILNSTTGTDVQTACDSHTWIDGNTYTSSNNTATHTLINAAGCDSLVTLDLTINNVDDGISIIDDTVLHADQNGASYQWLDCDNDFAPISGETAQELEVSANGSYAVEVTIDNCSDTSDCIEVNDLKIGDQSPLSEITVYPNPTSGKVNIDLGTLQNVTIELSTIEGKVLSREETTQSLHMIDINAPKGLFIIKVNYGKSSKYFKVVKM